MCHDCIYQPEGFEGFCFPLAQSPRLPTVNFKQLNQLWNRKKRRKNRQDLFETFLWSVWQDKHCMKWLHKRNSESRCALAHTWQDLWTPTYFTTNLCFHSNITILTDKQKQYSDIHITTKQKVLSFTIRMSPLCGLTCEAFRLEFRE